MPNFNTHWLVAIAAIDSAPKEVQRGWRIYQEAALWYADELQDIVKTPDQGKLADAIEDTRKEWEGRLKWERTRASSEDVDANFAPADYPRDAFDPHVICFSAYMTGACGPDFWMLPTKSLFAIIPDLAPAHFDLGHYNRSFQQYNVSVAALIPNKASWGLSDKAEIAYFCGMSTHFGTDLLLHELVNISDGAYNLHEKKWENEQKHERKGLLGAAKTALGAVASVVGLAGSAALLAAGGVAHAAEAVGGLGLSLVDTVASWLGVGSKSSPSGAGGQTLSDRIGGRSLSGLVDEVAQGLPSAGNPLVELLADVKNFWSTHNKVEHYWDSYVRYRYLGNYSPEADAEKWDKLSGFQKQIGLPVVEQLRAIAAGDAKALKVLEQDRVRCSVDKALLFPWVFADAIVDKNPSQLTPFIYDRVVHKEKGAYPASMVPKSPCEEATARQMNDSGGKSEKNKLRFFSSAANKEGVAPWSNNYLTYLVCPNLDKVRENGLGIFYDLDALEPFAECAKRTAADFLVALQAAYEAKDVDSATLGPLDRFWNLDTGIALRVENVASSTEHEVITRLDFAHITEKLPIAYKRQTPYLPASGKQYQPKTRDGFDVKSGGSSFDALAKVIEKKGDKGFAYHDRLALEGDGAKSPSLDGREVDASFFAASSGAPGQNVPTPTGSPNTGTNQIIGHRLNLWIRVPIASLGGGKDDTGFFLFNDESTKLNAAVKESFGAKFYATIGLSGVSDSATEVWLHGDKLLWVIPTQDPAKVIHQTSVADDDGSGGGDATPDLRTFSSHLFFNVEPEDLKDATGKVMERQTGEDPQKPWNNVIPRDKPKIGRNFAVCTGRTKVLHPKGEDEFKPKEHYGYYENLSPTEQVFLSIYPLVKTEKGCFDMISREKVDESTFKKLIKIDAVGVVKLVLLYVLDRDGARQLNKCWIDGIKRDVTRPS